ncbi:MAG: hypothetical protein DRP11_02040 [Candidatus Aenigmatarchaeota archaeon]|nr:MAG: hypothetical protein DRP11_02040 [Candidatus Aenigmarchaeota archaeon]
MAKGQIFSNDFLLAVIIFMLILTTIQATQMKMFEKIDNDREKIYYESLLSRTDTLILYEGYPEFWSPSDVEVLGFAQEPSILNVTKIKYFVSMDYDKLKELLGVRGREFYVEFTDSEGNVISDGGIVFKKGRDDWEGAEEITVVRRGVILNGREAVMKVVTWK